MKIHYTTLTGIDNDTGKWQTGVIFVYTNDAGIITRVDYTKSRVDGPVTVVENDDAPFLGEKAEGAYSMEDFGVHTPQEDIWDSVTVEDDEYPESPREWYNAWVFGPAL